jgi:hypothetical protein
MELSNDGRDIWQGTSIRDGLFIGPCFGLSVIRAVRPEHLPLFQLRKLHRCIGLRGWRAFAGPPPKF